MTEHKKPAYYLVAASALPEIYEKVTAAKERLETGESTTVAEAVKAVGISRSAFYKYKDVVTPFIDMKSGRIINFNMTLKNKPGILSGVLSIFADSGVNILTINQNIPVNGVAAVSVAAEVLENSWAAEQLMEVLRQQPGVVTVDVLAG